ncbi:phytanoyl-CoA dioxygenase [Phlyctema vagabunda]|uniref:Phytanoyl-CoA dioxygenase n=1 Tax=Phlyctema vagabunda TaxID=108571 RepID=A0ABR4P783_9HELO
MAPSAIDISVPVDATTTPSIKKILSDSRLATAEFQPIFGDFRDNLVRDGYAVVKAAVPRDRADVYGNAFYDFLEGFNLGYDRNDPSTIKRANLPVINEKGMVLDYAASHESFVWQIRSEPSVVETFEKVHGTKDLIVSFDAINIGLQDRSDFPANKPWPHQDQDPARPGFRCLQGLVNLQPCGDKDGGLIVCKGGHRISEAFHRDMVDEPRIPAWTPEWYGFTDKGMKWLEDRGLEWVKVCAEPGDLILWDSRTPHYNVPTSSKQDRMAIYTCFMPVSEATQEDLIRKKRAFEERLGTTHWPNARHLGTNIAKRDGSDCPHNRSRPSVEPVLTERAFKLTGIPYIKA